MNIRKMFHRKSKDPFTPGIYKYRIEYPEGGYNRLHLRVESDLNGILWINGNESFYLNESGALFTWCAINRKTDEEALRIIHLHYKTMDPKIDSDYFAFKPTIENLLTGHTGACDICQSGIDKTTPFSEIPDAPYRMDLALTYGCNNCCEHCYNEPGRGLKTLGLDEWKRVLDKLNEIAIPHVIFTGGEPTLVPFLPELIAYADELGIVTGMNSNGRKLKDPEFARRLKQGSLDHIQITLESINPVIHDRMVGVNGAWNETVEGIRNAVREGIFVNTNTTLLTHNATVQDVKALADFLNNLGVKTIGLNALIYAGKGKEVESGISAEKLPELLQAAKDAVKNNGQKLLWYTPTQYCVFDPMNEGLGYKTCTAAKYSMCIEPDGNVLPCQSWYEPVGNILNDPWEQIWNAPLCKRLRYKEYMPQKCSECESLNICSCGCPLEIDQNADAVRPRCGIPECF